MIDYDALMSLQVSPIRRVWTERDVILYALGIGAGDDPLDARQLAFVYERGLKVMPSFIATLCMDAMPGALALGVDPVQLLHIEQQMVVHAELPVRGAVVARGRVRQAMDKGPRGAIIVAEARVEDAETGRSMATLVGTMLAKDGGGFGGPEGEHATRPAPPARPPDRSVIVPTRADQALLYRLSGDYNPLHADPAEARRVGFARPILHGMCTYGIVCRTLLGLFGEWQPAGLCSLNVRFAAPVLPGDRLSLDFWREGDGVIFQGEVDGVPVVKDGYSLMKPIGNIEETCREER